jgi:hypothetical protein
VQDLEIQGRQRELDELNRKIEALQVPSETLKAAKNQADRDRSSTASPNPVSTSQNEDARSRAEKICAEGTKQCNEILADPNLSSQDKVFIFMMIYATFSDLEREEQLAKASQEQTVASGRPLLSPRESIFSELKRLEQFRETLVDSSNKMKAEADALIQRTFR